MPNRTVSHPSSDWLGRVIDAFGRPADGSGLCDQALEPTNTYFATPSSCEKRLGGKVDLGVQP